MIFLTRFIQLIEVLELLEEQMKLFLYREVRGKQPVGRLVNNVQ